ncbi:MAG: UvrD-helicase domain-containing protein [Cryobacterium sp.]|nr:UvrD-helicase domain-containing protein [Oligoflexia bacterium]
MIDFDEAPGAVPSSPRRPTYSPNFGGFSGRENAPLTPRTLAPGEVPAYLESLNPPQREAAEHVDGPLIVLAGAGSGKTKMLTSRIAYLMDVRGVPANRILAVTFTNKAAREMKARVERHLHSSGASGFFGAPEIGTFHAICVRILRRELAATPFTKPFVIYDDSDQLSLVKRVIEKLGIDDKAFSAKGMQAGINRLKCDAIEPKELDPSPHDLFERNLKRVYEEYQKDLFANNALDFGEILCMPYRIFRDHPEIRARYQQRFLYIHVDEYQDTNRAQYLLLSQLAKAEFGGHQNICVVGDEDQSIYKWRGADIRNILDFETDYPGAKIVKLEQNYRSSKTIIKAAAAVIKNNRERKDKTLWTANGEGPLILRTALADERAEAEYVIGEVKRIAANEDRPYTDFAIFYRTHAQSRQFEEVFRREKIPYEIVGGLRFYDRKEIKDVLSYFKVLQNPQDSVSLKRIINTPARGIGKTTIDKLEALQTNLEFAHRNSGANSSSEAAALAPGEVPEFFFAEEEATDTSLWAALRMAAKDPSLTSAGTAKKLMSFYAFMERLFRERPNLLISELYHLILDETHYVAELRKEGTDEASARIENLEEFDTVLQEFEEAQLEGLTEEDITRKKAELLPIFLEESALAGDIEGKSKDEQEKVPSLPMMSLHSSKGLEYPVVFLVGMEEGLFPSIRGTEKASDEDIEEERRLCYVGITRAREVLYLTHASIRRIWGQINYQEPARFFQEIPEELLEFKDLSVGIGADAFRAGSSRHFERKSWGSDWGSGGSGGESTGRTTGRSTMDDYSQLTDRDRAKAAAGTRARTGGVYRIGSLLDHPDYGSGKVIAQEGSGNDEKVTVQFSRGGPRKFLVRFIESYFSS